MSGGVTTVTIGPKADEQRLDKWFLEKYPGLTFGRLQKLLRKGEVRVDGKRIKDAKFILKPGHALRIPPLDKEKTHAKPKIDNDRLSAEDVEMIQACVLYKDDYVIVLNKPAGLAVQGGSNITRHVDGMLGALKFDTGERPRLVHRIDKDTSGILVLARTQKVARFLTAAFRDKDVRKAYWAIVVGVPEQDEGRIELPLLKLPSANGERVVVDEVEGKRAVTEFKVIEKIGRRAAWVEMEPITGRTHQLRVHMKAIDTPILGDGKYGGSDAFLTGAEIAPQLHLHARAVRFAHPGGGNFEITAPLPQHMKDTWDYLGLDERLAAEAFSDDA
jgi:23S rRNA pseudouridine955/2504/2580 synthase